jgi:hypothetical protein
MTENRPDCASLPERAPGLQIGRSGSGRRHGKDGPAQRARACGCVARRELLEGHGGGFRGDKGSLPAGTVWTGALEGIRPKTAQRMVRTAKGLRKGFHAPPRRVNGKGDGLENGKNEKRRLRRNVPDQRVPFVEEDPRIARSVLPPLGIGRSLEHASAMCDCFSIHDLSARSFRSRGEAAKKSRMSARPKVLILRRPELRNRRPRRSGGDVEVHRGRGSRHWGPWRSRSG